MLLHRSNRLEHLADALAEVLAQPLADPLAPERLVVQSPGMFEWVAVELARRQGIAANLAWWRPRQLVEAVFRAALGEHGLRLDAWSRDRLAWVLMDLLPEVKGEPDFGVLARWLAEADGDAGRLFQLARRLAHVFDQYTVYRYDLVQGWERGEGDDWQARLWRRLVRRLDGGHVAHVAERFFARVDGPRPPRLPHRLVLFGITTLPPLYLQVLEALSAWTEVHLFQLAPSEDWFADVRSRREIAHLLRGRRPEHGEEAERAHHLEEGHPLVARLGKVGRDLQALLEGHLDYQPGIERFTPSGATTLLGTLQDDVLLLRHRGRAAPRHRVDAGDRSLEVHGCHSPMREVEVLRDRLHRLLDADRTLRPRDICVMMPDVSVHGPLVEAVFGLAPGDPLRLPFTIADRPLGAGNVVARALGALFDLVGSRLPASEVLELLSHAPLRRRFGVDERELDDLQQLVHAAGVRWGLDVDHRAAVGQPPDPVTTWERGLDRLVLGHAMGDLAPWRDIVPMPQVQGAAVHAVDRLAALVQLLAERLVALERPRPVTTWRDDLLALVDDLFGGEVEHFDAVQAVRGVLTAAAADAEAAGYRGAVSLDVLRRVLDRHLEDERRPGGFLRAGITFCEMLPMRSIPFRVVCLLGLSDRAFPRADPRLGFDLVARHPRLGDRSKRQDDRYLVLEAVLSARDHLLVTYVSRRVRDNAEVPPSVVLSELLDVLDEGFEAPDGGPIAAHVVVEHPLQPFSPEYLPETPSERLFTYDPVAAAGAASLHQGGVAVAAPFLPGPIPADDVPAEVDVDELARFLADPVAWFHRHRLGVRPVADATVVLDREPLEVKEADEHALGERLLDLRRDGLDADTAWEVVLAEGRVPLGALSAAVRRRVAGAVEALVAAAADVLDEPEHPPTRVDVEVAGVRVTGRLTDLRRSARVELGYRSFTGHEGGVLVAPWLRHLLLQLAPGALPRATRVYARFTEGGARGAGLVRELRPLEDPSVALGVLADLVDWYRRGHGVPLPFLPDAGWAFLGSRHAGGWQKARKAAQDRWRLRPDDRATWERLVGGERAFERKAVGGGPRFDEVTLGVLEPLYRRARTP